MGEQISRYRRNQFRQEMWDRGEPFFKPEKWIAPKVGIVDDEGRVHLTVKAI